MADEQLFLKSKVIVEPLQDRFFAWPHTVAPVQSAMNLAFLQVPLLESYLQSPQVHVAASNNPELRGGYFINVPEERAGEVRDLLDAIKRDRAHVLDFAAAVAAYQELLRANATGFDLTPLYPKLPPELGGFVELAYDTDNQAQLRFMEPLVYTSDVYQESRQSVQLSFETGVERPFILSTPRLPSPDVLELAIPFRHPGLEELFKARVHGTTLAHLRDALELDDAQAAHLATMLDTRPSLAPTATSTPTAVSATSGTPAWSCRPRRPRSSPTRSSAPTAPQATATPWTTCPTTSTWSSSPTGTRTTSS